MTILCFQLPEGANPDDFVVVPKVAPEDQLYAWADCDTYASMSDCYAAMLAAAPPVKVVELPALHITLANDDRAFGWNACLDEIERRLK